jgi:heme/copper-type cytochrome/quinol oxidase subunit 3
MPPKDWYEPIVMPAIMTVFGVLIWWMAMMAEQKGKNAPWKWLGIVFLALGIFFGLGPFMEYMDPVYRAGLPGNKRVVAVYYGSLFLPLLSLIGCVLWQVFGKRFVPQGTVSSEQ